MQILLTGSEGFIGSHLAEKLVKLGYKVKCTVLYNSFNNYGWLESLDKDILNEIEICFGDIRDFNFVKKSMKNCDMAIHLAALIGIPYSYIAPKSYIETKEYLLKSDTLYYHKNKGYAKANTLSCGV